MSKHNRTTAAALGTAFAASLAAAPAAADTANPFSLTELESGYMVASSHEGEGRCGANNGDKAKKEGKCGADKAKEEGKCGADKDREKKQDKEGKCGEGKCGSMG